MEPARISRRARVSFRLWLAQTTARSAAAREQVFHARKKRGEIFLSATYAHATKTFLGDLRQPTHSHKAQLGAVPRGAFDSVASDRTIGVSGDNKTSLGG